LLSEAGALTVQRTKLREVKLKPEEQFGHAGPSLLFPNLDMPDGARQLFKGESDETL
jgi:hypothetical protein